MKSNDINRINDEIACLKIIDSNILDRLKEVERYLGEHLAEPPKPAEDEKWGTCSPNVTLNFEKTPRGKYEDYTKAELCNLLNFGEACRELLEDIVNLLKQVGH